MDKFWMCFVEGTSSCSMQHINRTEAMEEAERLLRQDRNIGKKVYLLEVVGYVHFEQMPVKWEQTIKTIGIRATQ